MKRIVSGIMLTSLLVVLTALAFKIRVSAASPELPLVEWSKTYGGTSNDEADSVIQTADGGYALVGETSSFGAGGRDMWLVKLDANGNEQWNKTFGGTDCDFGSSILQTTDGGFILVGSTASSGAGIFNIYVVKTDPEGNMQWNKTYGGTFFDLVETERSIIQTSDGGYIIAGSTFFLTAGCGISLIKINANGEMQWNRIHGDSWGARSIVQTSDSGYAIAGGALLGGIFDFLLVKTDSTGNIQWYKTYGGLDHDTANSLTVTSDGGYALVGETSSFGAGTYDVWLVKTDANGNMQWSKTYGGTNIDDGTSLVQTSDEGYAVACRQYSLGAGNGDFWLIKSDSLGNVEWDMTFGEKDTDLSFSVIVTQDGGYAVAGSTSSFGAGAEDVWLIKLAPEIAPPPLSVSTSPLSASILVGQPIIFTSTVSGGYTPYSYQWYLNGATVSGATSNTWTFTPTTVGIYYIHLKVTDAKGSTAQSEPARITVATVPVGGYSIPIQAPTKAEPLLPYIALIATLTAIFTKLRPKTKRKH